MKPARSVDAVVGDIAADDGACEHERAANSREVLRTPTEHERGEEFRETIGTVAYSPVANNQDQAIMDIEREALVVLKDLTETRREKMKPM